MVCLGPSLSLLRRRVAAWPLPPAASARRMFASAVRRPSASASTSTTTSTPSSSPLPSPPSSSSSLTLEALFAVHPARVDNLLNQHGYCGRREARKFLREHTVTAVVVGRAADPLAQEDGGGRHESLTTQGDSDDTNTEATATTPSRRRRPSAAARAPAAVAVPPGDTRPLPPPPPASDRAPLSSLVTTGAVRVDPRTLRVDGEAVPYAGVPLHIALHKPVGSVCTLAEEEGQSVFEFLPPEFLLRSPSLLCVGRLDRMSSGLLLFTQSGPLNERLTSPRRHVAKEYLVALERPLSPDGREARLFASGGVELADGARAAPVELRPHRTDPRVCKVVLTEGRHHQIRRLFAAAGNAVVGIHRVRIGGLALEDLRGGKGEGEGGLKAGEWAFLGRREMELLLGEG
jgi:16S rRNA pseudouridine516 synthase